MKTIFLGVAVLLLAGSAWARLPDLMLGKADGLPWECEVRGYDPDEGTVRLKTDGGLTNLLFSSFRPETQQTITGWAEDKAFSSAFGFRVKIKEVVVRKKEMDKKEGSTVTQGDVEWIRYDIYLENRTPFELKDLLLEHTIFYEQIATHYKNKEDKRCKSDESRITIAANKAKTIQTDEVLIRDYAVIPAGGSFFGNDYGLPTSLYKDKLLGVQVSLSKTAENGDVLEREFKDGRVPKKLDEYNVTQVNGAISEKSSAEKKAEHTSTGTKKSAKGLDEKQVEHLKRLAENGDPKANYYLYRHYDQIGDSENRKLWAEKIQQMARDNPDDQFAARAAERIARIEKTQND